MVASNQIITEYNLVPTNPMEATFIIHPIPKNKINLSYPSSIDELWTLSIETKNWIAEIS